VAQVQDGCVGGGGAVDLWVDQHFVVGSEDCVVEHGVVLSSLHTFGLQQRLEQGDGVVDPSGDGAADALFGAAFG